MNDLVLFNNEDALPAHLTQMGGLGNDNITSDDLTLPRINLLQQLSPQTSKQKAEYIEGAEPGQFLNTVSLEITDTVRVINLYFNKTWVVFRNRKFGGGDFQGNHDTAEAARAHLTEQGLDPAQYDINETGNHYVLLLDENNTPVSPAVISMSSSKMNTSRRWNTELNLLTQRYDVPRFGSVWELGSKVETNKRGEDYYNLTLKQLGFAPEGLLEAAKEQYEAVALPFASKQEAAPFASKQEAA